MNYRIVMGGELTHRDHKYIKKEKKPYGWRYWYARGIQEGKKERTYRDTLAESDKEYDKMQKDYYKQLAFDSIAGKYAKELVGKDSRPSMAYSQNNTNHAKYKYYSDLARASEKNIEKHFNNGRLIDRYDRNTANTFGYRLGQVSGTIKKAGHDFLEKFKKK